MSSETIVRLRGDGPALIWPAAELRPHLDWCAEMWRLYPDPARHDDDATERRARGALATDWTRAIWSARSAALTEFATAQGWTPAARALPPSSLVPPPYRGSRGLVPGWARDLATWDHPEWLRTTDGAAAVVHLYPDLALDRVPSGIVVDRLPTSWYWPRRTEAYVFRSASAVRAGQR